MTRIDTIKRVGFPEEDCPECFGDGCDKCLGTGLFKQLIRPEWVLPTLKEGGEDGCFSRWR